MKKSYKIGLSIIGSLLVIFAFTDLQISKAIYNQQSTFGFIFEAIGEFPAALIALFCSMSLMLTRNKDRSVKYILGTIGYSVLVVLFALMAVMLPVKYLSGPTLLIPLLAILYVGLFYIITKKYTKTNREELRKAAIVGLLTFVFVTIAFNLIKMGWGRERYRNMVATGAFEGFSMWFIPKRFTTNNEFMSFPSGHSANAAIMIWITLIPTFVTSLKDKKNWFIGFATLWIVLVPISRIIVGAHFASDVTMGVTVTLVIFTLLKEKYIKKENIKDKEKISSINT